MAKDEFDVSKIIREYDDPALKKCIHLLYPVFNLTVMKEEDIRWMDLLENIYRYLGFDHKHPDRKYPWNEYVDLIRRFDDSYYALGSQQAGLYHKRMNTAIDRFKTTNDIEALEDAVKAFLTFMRCWQPSFVPDKKNHKDFHFELTESDELWLRNLENHRFELAQKGILDKIPAKLPVQPKTTITQNRIIFVVSVLIYCRIMDYEAGFTEE